MKKEERESQIVRSPKSTNLFHLLPVLLPGTVSTRSLSRSSLSPTSFSRLHHFRHAVIPDLGLDLIRTKAVSLSVIPLVDETRTLRRKAILDELCIPSCLSSPSQPSRPEPGHLLSPLSSRLLLGFFFTLHRVRESLVHSDKGTKNESILGFLEILNFRVFQTNRNRQTNRGFQGTGGSLLLVISLYVDGAFGSEFGNFRVRYCFFFFFYLDRMSEYLRVFICRVIQISCGFGFVRMLSLSLYARFIC